MVKREVEQVSSGPRPQGLRTNRLVSLCLAQSSAARERPEPCQYQRFRAIFLGRNGQETQIQQHYGHCHIWTTVLALEPRLLTARLFCSVWALYSRFSGLLRLSFHFHGNFHRGTEILRHRVGISPYRKKPGKPKWLMKDVTKMRSGGVESIG